VSGPAGARPTGAAARPATAARAGTEATRDVRDDDAAIELGLARVAQTASRNDGRGAGAVADALGAAQQVSKGHAVPSAERWPDAVWLPVDGRATPVRLERVDGPLATVLGPRGRVVVAREELTALEPRRERVAHARVDADGKVDLGTGLKVGVATRDRAPYDVVFDHALGRFVAAPSGHYRPVVHGQTAASSARATRRSRSSRASSPSRRSAMRAPCRRRARPRPSCSSSACSSRAAATSPR
jgi:hypothetical protein